MSLESTSETTTRRMLTTTNHESSSSTFPDGGGTKIITEIISADSSIPENLVITTTLSTTNDMKNNGNRNFIQNNNNDHHHDDHHHHHHQHQHLLLTTAVGMFVLGYLLGSSQPESSKAKTMSIISQTLDLSMVPFYCICAAIYLLVSITKSKKNSLSLRKSSSSSPPTKIIASASSGKQQQPIVTTSRELLPALASANSSTFGSSIDGSSEADDTTTNSSNVLDFTGSYQLVENQNFEELLAVQGVPWAMRCAANKLRPIHRLTHDLSTHQLTIKIEGIIETETSYEIGGPPVECQVQGRKFRDIMRYVPPDGIQTIKRAIEDGYSVSVLRKLNPDKQSITMTSTVQFDDPSKKDVTAIQIFERMADSTTTPAGAGW